MSDIPIATTSLDATQLTKRLVEEGLVGLSPATKLFGEGRSGRSMHPATLTRYHHEGVRRSDGTFIKLECVRVGSKLMTSKAAVLRFIAAQQESPSVVPSLSETPAVRRSMAAAATSELDAILN